MPTLPVGAALTRAGLRPPRPPLWRGGWASLPPRARWTATRLVWPSHARNLLQLRDRPASATTYSLGPCLERRAVFVHIPKCAGITVAQTVFGCLAGGHTPNVDYEMLLGPRRFGEVFKFTFVRNPWDRLVSAYYFLRDGGLGPIDRRARARVARFETFEHFVDAHLQSEDFRQTLHFVPQNEFLRAHAGEVAVDFVGRFERFDEDFGTICERFGVTPPDRPTNAGRSRPRDYRDAYTDRSRKIVARVYEKDIDLFGYAF